MNIVFIFARSGSQGLKNKNIKKFNGKPLIYWTIKQAQKLKNIDEIILSTDSKKIAKIGEKYGAKIYFIRPKYLASNTSNEWLSWKHAVNFLKKKFNKIPKKIVILPVTSPCRKVSDIEKCIKLYDKNNIDISMVVTKSNHHPSFNMVSKKNHKISLLNSKKRAKRRQEFNDTYNLTTVSIITNPNIILKKNYIFDCKVGAIEIPNSRAHDIDDLNDFKYCEFLFKTKNYDKFLK